MKKFEVGRNRKIMVGPPGRSTIVLAAAIVTMTSAAAWAQDKAKIDAGENLYNDYCYTCHGERLVSSGQTFDLRRLTPNDRARFENSVLAGKGQMPPWRGVLNSEQIDLLWTYIRANAHQ
jgi:mono/diheme cytochrome c family protein